MSDRDSSLTGAAGVFFVASYLAYRNIHVSITIGNAPTVDVLASSADGTNSVAIQVKTTEHALRHRGRGTSKAPDHYEWDVGRKAATVAHANLIFAFVDLKPENVSSDAYSPDVYFLTSEDLVDWFENRQQQRTDRGKGDIVRYRFHPDFAIMEPRRNNWRLIENLLTPPGSHM